MNPTPTPDAPKRPKKFRKHTCAACGHWFYTATALGKHIVRQHPPTPPVKPIAFK